MYCCDAAAVSISEISSLLNFMVFGGSSLAWGSVAAGVELYSVGRWKSGHEGEDAAGMMGLRREDVRVGAGLGGV